MSQEIVIGTIKDITPDGTAIIEAVVPNLEKATKRNYQTVTIGYNDSRHISPEQRRKVYALIHEIADYTGDSDEGMKEELKLDFVLHYMQNIQRKMFSLSDVPMEIASSFIDYLVDFIVRNGIPTNKPLVDMAEDIGKFIYVSTVNKKCCVCGRPADIHHCEGSRIGAGNDREQVHHLGRDVIALCREHHTECHSGEKDFLDKFHLFPIKADEKICKVYKLKK